MILSLITAFLKAATSYLELKNKSFYYDILEKSRKRCSELASEIEKLRAEGSQSSTDRADVLLLQFKAVDSLHVCAFSYRPCFIS